MSDSVKIEAKVEQDCDFGKCVFVYVDGKKQDSFVKADSKDAKFHALRHVAAEQFFRIKRLEKELEQMRMLKNTVQSLLRQVGSL